MKKVFGIILVVAFFMVMLVSISLVSAENNAEVVSRNVAEMISSLFSDVNMGPTNLSSVLLGILLWMILYSVFKMTKLIKGFFLSGGIALIVTILTFIYLPDGFVIMLAAQYAGLGATILTALPFLIALWFSSWATDSLMVAKGIWAIFTVYYFVMFVFSWGLATSAYVDKDILFSFTPVIFGMSIGKITSIDLIYIAGAGASILMFIFIGWIRKEVWKSKLESDQEKGKKRAENLGTALDLGQTVTDVMAGQ